MVRLNIILKYIFIIFSISLLVILPFIIFNRAYFNWSFNVDTDLASRFGDFFGGFIGTLFSILSVLLLIYTITSQYIETSKNKVKDHFFKMLDYHTENVRSTKVGSIEATKADIVEEGRRAFVVYKIQLKRLLQAVNSINETLDLNLSSSEKIDVAYICFFYGQSETWVDFIKGKLSIHRSGSLIATEMLKKVQENESLKLGRTNQTELSSYFRNMYNAIKLVDNDKYLSQEEKVDLIKIYRAQLSNPELYILFFNLVSRFGTKWHMSNYITKYELLTNLPHDYCDGYDPKDYFDISYEEDEIGLWIEST
ncbi:MULTISPECIES: putative phage abortive infection protein [unclassified Psychrobacter]|uniref:putative phage abortive infection protein n=1 Tax=unclassified Psychrobacter TaxID=196806 RepID=UPI003FD13A0E